MRVSSGGPGRSRLSIGDVSFDGIVNLVHPFAWTTMDSITKTDAVKRPYTTPTLTVHGTLEQLTQRVSTRGHSDGGFLFWSRTGGA